MHGWKNHVDKVFTRVLASVYWPFKHWMFPEIDRLGFHSLERLFVETEPSEECLSALSILYFLKSHTVFLETILKIIMAFTAD